MTPLKVLHIISVDKQNYYLNNLADYSDAREVEFGFVTLAAETCDFVKDMRARGRRVWGLDTLKRSRYPQAYSNLRKLLLEEKPDIVHTHLFDASLIGLTAAKRRGLKTVLTRHHSDAIHEIARPLKRRFYLRLENYVSKRSDHIIAPSRMVRDFLVEREGVSKEKVTIIPYGQTPDRFEAVNPEQVAEIRSELKMNGRLSLVCVSRLFHRKGHKYLFEAFSRLKQDGVNVVLYLVGDGEYRSELTAVAADLNIVEDVHFLGWRDDALRIIAAADVVVHPSLEDALSSAVIESLMLERPIVATDISGVRDSLDDGKYGKIVQPADSESFLTGLREVIADLQAARSRAKAGKRYLLDYMGAANVARRYTEVYKNL